MPTTLVKNITKMDMNFNCEAAWPSRQASVRAVSDTQEAMAKPNPNSEPRRQREKRERKRCVISQVQVFLWTLLHVTWVRGRLPGIKW